MRFSSSLVLRHILFLHLWISYKCSETERDRNPNFILFVGDDVGFGDLSSYGHPTQEWGAIDDLAREGVRFTQCYAAAVQCTPSRAALMTGRLPVRTGMVGDTQTRPMWDVHQPCLVKGLPHEEDTIAEALARLGYTTGMAGKWHLGINAYSHNDGNYLPHRHGFQQVGHILPHTLNTRCNTAQSSGRRPKSSQCFLYHNTTIVQQPLHLENLTGTLVQDAKAFIYDHADQPFFYYMSFPQAHTPMFNDPRFKDKSRRGVYGDQLNEMAWGVSEILDTVKELDLDRETLTMFVSDHGPHLEMCQHGGDPGPFKGSKGNYYEGGVRVPAIVRWPGKISPGRTSTALISLMDIFTTFVDLAGGLPPQDRHIDGKSLRGVLLGDVEPDPWTVHDVLYFYCQDGNRGTNLTAVRYKQFKIHYRVPALPSEKEHLYDCEHGSPYEHFLASCASFAEMDPPLVYNVEHDPRELYALSSQQYAHALQEVEQLVLEHAQTMTDVPEPLLSKANCRKHVTPCCNPPYCVCNYRFS